MPHAASTIYAYTSARPDVIALAPTTVRRALDIGCSDGSVGSQFRTRGAEVWGIEYDPAFAGVACTRLDHVICGDAVEEIERLASDGQRFDLIICADVLEHLREPERVLAAARRLLAPGGHVIVSLPNVRWFMTFWYLGVRRTWPRHSEGVYDRTHLVWFTDVDARRYFKEAGFVVEATDARYRLSRDPLKRRNKLARFVIPPPLRDFFVYQHLYRLR